MPRNGPSMTDPTLRSIPDARIPGLREIIERLTAARHVVLTTHLNADGDGAGSQVAVASWLGARGVRTTIVNPTPFPPQFRFMVTAGVTVADWGEAAAESALRDADCFLVLDTSEPHRVGALAEILPPDRTIVIDHHPVGAAVVGDLVLRDTTAAATGELIYDLITLSGDDWPPPAVLGSYVALVTDTGSFRYSNTTPRTHAVAGELLGRGVDPEAVYQKLFATAPRRRLELLREALGSLHTDPDGAVAWMYVTDEMVRSVQAEPEDLEGLIDHVRSLEGTEIAILFRETSERETKISFRSNGAANVNRLARQFGGGGHVKASGALIPQPPEAAMPRVLTAAREIARQL